MANLQELLAKCPKSLFWFKTLEDQAARPSFSLNQQDYRKRAELRSLTNGIIYALQGLEELAITYSSLSTVKKTSWDRLRFDTKVIDDIRARLILHSLRHRLSSMG
jgi:hypothetical protein